MNEMAVVTAVKDTNSFTSVSWRTAPFMVLRTASYPMLNPRSAFAFISGAKLFDITDYKFCAS